MRYPALAPLFALLSCWNAFMATCLLLSSSFYPDFLAPLVSYLAICNGFEHDLDGVFLLGAVFGRLFISAFALSITMRTPRPWHGVLFLMLALHIFPLVISPRGSILQSNLLNGPCFTGQSALFLLLDAIILALPGFFSFFCVPPMRSWPWMLRRPRGVASGAIGCSAVPVAVLFLFQLLPWLSAVCTTATEPDNVLPLNAFGALAATISPVVDALRYLLVTVDSGPCTALASVLSWHVVTFPLILCVLAWFNAEGYHGVPPWLARFTGALYVSIGVGLFAFDVAGWAACHFDGDGSAASPDGDKACHVGSFSAAVRIPRIVCVCAGGLLLVLASNLQRLHFDSLNRKVD